jgi:uncharacterized protein YcbK (DUF882 family)
VVNVNARLPVLVGRTRLKIRGSFVARAGFSCGLAAFLLLFGSRALQNAIAEGDTRTISLHHVHTNEDITITFKRDGRYDEAALEKLNWFLRDWRREQQTRMDPHLIDLVWEVQRETGSKSPIWVVCGYRSPQTNAMLRRRSSGVARFSQHMLGHAMDFYIPGVPLTELRVIGLRLQRGGVGFYPTSGSPFVHMDTGNVRHWPRMTREQLVRVFPDGRTVHIPSDGRPLPGYALALADIRKHGGSPSEMSIESARGAGVDVADAGTVHHSGNVFARLFGLGKPSDDEDNDADAAAPAGAPAAPAAPAAAVPLRSKAKAAVAAAIENAEDKLAAEKTKLVKVVSKAHVIGRAEAAPAVPAAEAAGTRVAALTANDVISARGYWSGLSDGTSAAQPTSTAVDAVAAVARPRGAERATAADNTGSVRPIAGARDDRVAPELALAYAEEAAQDAQPRPIAVATMAAAPQGAGRAAAAQTGASDVTIAVKRVSGRPASAIFTIASKTPAARMNDPWLRSVVLSPSVRRFLTVTALGARDFRALAPLMVKPDSSVMMTFSAQPQPGLAHDRFSGSAIVFVSTVSYPMRSASLQ